ncbi:MAG: LacI family transcriptional regulator [Planctomycetaceae bacterium]|nr:LacI family transcriptional regulator [Planctomycetaceae bacterium]
MIDKSPISLKELAKMANVSTATISRVLNDNGRFSEETRHRVLSLIKETGYSPNVAAKALRTRNAYAVGLIIPEVVNQFFARIIDSLGRVFFDHNYSLFVCCTDEDQEKNNAMVANLLGKGVDGLLYISRYPLHSGDTGVPVVCLDRVPPGDEERCSIVSDNRHGGRLAAETLIAGGSRNPVILCDPIDLGGLSTIENRLAGFEEGLRAAGVTWSRRTGMIKTPMTVGAARERISKAVRAGKRFDGVFSTLDAGALGALLGLEDTGIRVPDDVNVIGFDDVPLGEYSRPALTTIRQDVAALALNGAKLLLAQMEKKSYDCRHEVIPVALVKRGSVRSSSD